MSKETGELLLRLREKSKLTQEEVAEAIGCTRVAYTRYENGLREPKGVIAVKLAALLDVSVQELYGLSAPPEQQKSPAHMGEAELDEALVSVLVNLTPKETEKVRDFVSGLIAARKE